MELLIFGAVCVGIGLAIGIFVEARYYGAGAKATASLQARADSLEANLQARVQALESVFKPGGFTFGHVPGLPIPPVMTSGPAFQANPMGASDASPPPAAPPPPISAVRPGV